MGYVGSSDGWQDLKAHGEMTWEYTRAESGNVALTGEIGLLQCQGAFLLVIGFGDDPAETLEHFLTCWGRELKPHR